MKFTKTKFDKPTTGVGVVQVGKKTFSFDLKFKSKDGSFSKPKHFSFDHSDIPESLPEDFTLKNGKTYWFNIRSDGSAINDIRPAGGVYNVVSTGIARNNDDDFIVIERDGDFGKYWQFVANLEIVDGDNAGIVYPLYLPLANENKDGSVAMKFKADDEGNVSPVGNPDKSINIKRLFDFVISCGLVDISMPWKEEYEEDGFQEFLSALDKAIRKLKTKFVLVVKDGYPDTMTSFEGEAEDTDDDEEVEDDEDTEDEEDEPKSTSKTTKKQVVDADEDDEEDSKPVSRPSFNKLKKK